MEKDKRLVRILRLAHEIAQQPGRSFTDYATRFGVSERTIRRDVRALSQAGFRVQNTIGLNFSAEDIIPVSKIRQNAMRKECDDGRVSIRRKNNSSN